MVTNISRMAKHGPKVFYAYEYERLGVRDGIGSLQNSAGVENNPTLTEQLFCKRIYK